MPTNEVVWKNKQLLLKRNPTGSFFVGFYVNSWGRAKIGKFLDRVGAEAPARFYVLQKRIRFLK
jgi:hypothetical protein